MKTALLNILRQLPRSRLRYSCVSNRIAVPYPPHFHYRQLHARGLYNSKFQSSTKISNANPPDGKIGKKPMTGLGRLGALGRQYEARELSPIYKELQSMLLALPENGLSQGVQFGRNIAHDVWMYPVVKNEQAVKYAIAIHFGKKSKANSLDQMTLNSLNDCLRTLMEFPQVAAVVLMGHLTGGKPVFSAGASLNALREIKNPQDAKLFINTVRNVGDTIRDLPFPAIACIDGPCIGAGLEIAASCDIRYATTQSSFSMPEILLDIPSVVQARLLTEIVGWGRARELMLTGRKWDAQEALTAGLVSMTFASEELVSEHVKKVCEIFTHHSSAVSGQKALFKNWEAGSIDAGMDASVEAFAKTFESQEDRARISKAISDIQGTRLVEKEMKQVST